MSLPADAPWWQGAVLYQVYVRSWRDHDGDGYGDLAGVIDGLDHLAWLGVDGIWLSPTMPSPDDDWGYDVSDYYGVHPGLGTLDDLDRLVDEAAGRGIRVLLDLVPNHTSEAHPWFVDARSSAASAHRDYYVWADPGPPGTAPNTGTPPNNWVDATGTSAWTFDAASGQYYLHNFLPSQPDLNWWNPAVRAAFEDILRFWLDRGIAGFRIDVAHALYKDPELRDNPPTPVAPDARFGQREIYSKNRPEVHQVYRAWRKLAEAYSPPALLLGETWVLDLERLGRFYGDNDELQLAFNFAFLFSEFDADALRRTVAATWRILPAGACPVWTGSNHDVSRFPTRWCGGDVRKVRLALLILCTLPGTVVLYYGDEIGMVDVDVPASQQRDPMTKGGRGGRPPRDRARTPMQWSAAPGAGFSAGTVPGRVMAPWLPLGDNHARNVADQVADPTSVLALCRRLLALRHQALGGGVTHYEELPSGPQQWVYRSGDLLVAANFSDQAATLGYDGGTVVLSSADLLASAGPGITLSGWQGVIMTAT